MKQRPSSVTTMVCVPPQEPCTTRCPSSALTCGGEAGQACVRTEQAGLMPCRMVEVGQQCPAAGHGTDPTASQGASQPPALHCSPFAVAAWRSRCGRPAPGAHTRRGPTHTPLHGAGPGIARPAVQRSKGTGLCGTAKAGAPQGARCENTAQPSKQVSPTSFRRDGHGVPAARRHIGHKHALQPHHPL